MTPVSYDGTHVAIESRGRATSEHYAHGEHFMKNQRTVTVASMLIYSLLFPLLTFGESGSSASRFFTGEPNLAFVVSPTDQKLSPDLSELVNGADQNRTVKVILQSEDLNDPRLLNVLSQNGAKITARIAGLNMLAVELKVKAIRIVAAEKSVKNLSIDREIGRASCRERV